jgi:phage-related protein
MTWSVETWGPVVDAEIEALPVDIRAKLLRFQVEIERFGPIALPKPYAKYLGEGLWELRLSGRDGIARVIYVTVSVKRMILLRAFVKKTQKTPPSEIRLARQRLKQLMV